MLFDQLTQILGHCLVRLSQSAEAAQRIFATSVIRVIKVVVAPIQLLPSTSTATSSQPSLPPAPVLLPTKSFPVLIAGTPALGSGIYQAPTASFVLCILSVAISVMLVYGALKRLGFAGWLEKVVKSSLMTTLVQVCIVIATDRRCFTHTSILLASEYGKVFAHRAFTSGTSQLSFPVLASLPSGPTKTYLVPIAGSPSLGCVYQAPQAAAVLFVLSGVSSVLLLYGAAIRLGATETAPDIPGACTRTVCSLTSLVTSIVTIATKSARRRVTSILFFLTLPILKLVAAKEYPRLFAGKIPLAFTRLDATLLSKVINGKIIVHRTVRNMLNSSGLASPNTLVLGQHLQRLLNVAKLFIRATLKVLDRQAIVIVCATLSLLINYDISALPAIQQLVSISWRWWRLWRPDPGGAQYRTYPFVAGIPPEWDAMLPEGLVEPTPPPVRGIFGCGAWKKAGNFKIKPEFDHHGLQYIKLLGKGAFGTVIEASTRSGECMALKILRRIPEKKVDKKTLRRETFFRWKILLAEITVPLAMADHPAFPTIHGVWRNRGHFFIAMELGGKCLADYKTLSRPQIYHFGRQLIDGLNALHRRGILHRDIKPDNLLVKGDKLVIIDFGLSRRFSLRRRPPRFWAYEQGEYVAHGVCGTKGYMSPLVLDGGDYSFDADLWSVGVVLHEWLVRRRDPPAISGCGHFLEEPDDHLSLAQWEFFHRILSLDPQYRFRDWDAVKKDPMWLTLLE